MSSRLSTGSARPRGAKDRSPERTRLRQQPPAVRGDDLDRLEDVVEDRLADEVVEVDADPAGLDALAAARDLALELVRRLDVDAEQAVAVRAGARAAAARLDAEEVVEQRDDEVVVQVARRRGGSMNETIESRSASLVAEDLDVRVGRPALDRRRDEATPRARGSPSAPTASLSWKTSPARIDSTMAGVPPSSRCSGSAR